tara:strand:+ start:38 stop:1429 length:1392 start_codon:yes stop_codon:yes gene_type:complete
MTSIIKVDNIQDQDGNNIINENANTITIGASGDTVTLASGASQSGFGRTGTVDWDTTAKTASFTAVSGNGYFINTTSGAITVTLPASPSANDIVAVADYAGTAATNSITIARNGSPIEGSTINGEISTNRQTATFIYVDGTQGWVAVNSNDQSFQGQSFVTATGGTVTTCGNFKIHTFTGPGTFCVSCAGNPLGSSTVDYLVVAGGGGGAYDRGGGGGAGGYRESPGAASGCYSVSPLGAAPAAALPVTAQGYPITVGGGGAGQTGPGPSNDGNNSVFSTITSAGGGGGTGNFSPGATIPGGPGGSGGGAGSSSVPGSGGNGGTGNTPPVSPPQGNNGGDANGNGYRAGGGGGGALAVGQDVPADITAGNGGGGATSCITGSPVARAGGGGGGVASGVPAPGATAGNGGSGGGAPGSPGANSTNGTANTGGGGGGGGTGNGPIPGKCGSSGGSGIVIIRYKFQ